MARVIALNFLIFLVPFAVYFGWVYVRNGRVTGAGDWPVKVVGNLTAIGARPDDRCHCDFRPFRFRSARQHLRSGRVCGWRTDTGTFRMTGVEPIPSLAGEDWFRAASLQAVFAAIDRDGDTRIAGGAVRDALAGRPVKDVDLATVATPAEIIERATAAGLKTVPTGIDHGTITVVSDGVAYEVTTLREDVETDGRHAVVRFGADWVADARRRDFTINALYADATGRVIDPLGGYPDLVERRVRFVGDPDQRIAEDRLRILRFFRFSADFGKGLCDREGLVASIRGQAGLRSLSAERIGQEMRRLVCAPFGVPVLRVMLGAGIATTVLGGIGYPETLGRVLAIAPGASLILRMTGFGCRVTEDVERLRDRLRLANTERDAMAAAVEAGNRIDPEMDNRTARRRLYEMGTDTWPAAVALAFAWGRGTADDPAWRRLMAFTENWSPPRFPITGKDALGAGVPTGAAVGRLLRALEAWWIDQDFAPDAAALKARLQQQVAAQQ